MKLQTKLRKLYDVGFQIMSVLRECPYCKKIGFIGIDFTKNKKGTHRMICRHCKPNSHYVNKSKQKQNFNKDQKDKKEMRDRYIKSLIRKNTELKAHEMSDELIIGRREVLKIKRYLKQIKNDHPSL